MSGLGCHRARVPQGYGCGTRLRPPARLLAHRRVVRHALHHILTVLAVLLVLPRVRVRARVRARARARVRVRVRVRVWVRVRVRVVEGAASEGRLVVIFAPP